MDFIEFLKEHKPNIIYSLFIIAAVILFRYITNRLYKWIRKEKQKIFPNEPIGPLNYLKKILNLLWIILGIIAIIYLLADENKQSDLANDFQKTLYIGVVMASTITAAIAANVWIKHETKKKIKNHGDPTNYKFFRYMILVLIYFIGGVLCLFAFPSLKGAAQTALGGAGVMALIAGFAAQEALANVISGIFIIIFKPFKVNDLIKITDTMIGRVTDITLRHTIIKDFENKHIVIPNSIINKEKITNYDMSEQKICERIEIGISYDSDIDLAKKIIREECEKHPLILDNRSFEDKQKGEPIVKTAVIALGDSSVTIRAWTWEKNYDDSYQLRIDVLESVKKRFDKEGIEIPYPHQTLYIKNQ